MGCKNWRWDTKEGERTTTQTLFGTQAESKKPKEAKHKAKN
jgi:hypothetical protein